MNKKIESITLPYNFTPRPYQLNVLKAWDTGVDRIFWVAHRRSGKDLTIFANLSKKMMERVGTYYYFLPTYSQAKKVIWTGIIGQKSEDDRNGMKFLDFFPKQIVRNINQADMIIELRNGSILQMVGADNIDRIVGTNPIGVVFSEYSLMKPDVWNLISPILRENGGWAVFVMTPRGTNHAWDLMETAKQNDNWFVEVLTVEDTKALSKESLLEAQAEMPQDLFQQEYYCKFLDSGLGFFRRVDENVYEADKYTPGHTAMYQIGVDLAKYNDYTVISPFNLNDFHCLPQDSFNQMDYNLQKARIENAYLKHNRGRIIIDSTGVGEPVFDDLNARGMNIEPFRFTRTSRTDLLINLQMLLEQDKIKIPNDDVLIHELKSMTYELTATGSTKITVPSGKHDDRIMSLALAVWKIPPKPIKHSEMGFTQQTQGVSPMYPEWGF